jgi:hypothetical protein
VLLQPAVTDPNRPRLTRTAILCQTSLRLAVLRAPDATSLCKTKPALPIPALSSRALTDPIVTRRARTCVAMPALLQPDVPGQTTLEYAPPNRDCLAPPCSTKTDRALTYRNSPYLDCHAPPCSIVLNIAAPSCACHCHAKGPFSDGRAYSLPALLYSARHSYAVQCGDNHTPPRQPCLPCWAMPGFVLTGLTRKSLALTALLSLAVTSLAVTNAASRRQAVQIPAMRRLAVPCQPCHAALNWIEPRPGKHRITPPCQPCFAAPSTSHPGYAVPLIAMPKLMDARHEIACRCGEVCFAAQRSLLAPLEQEPRFLLRRDTSFRNFQDLLKLELTGARLTQSCSKHRR